jgi:uncharacterized protein YbbK (DUF523 family)
VSNKKIIAVSACLLGYKVRYDGEHQANESIQPLSEVFELLPVCPEMEIGLGVPREKIALHQQGLMTRLLTCGYGESIDLTEKVQDYAQRFLQMPNLAGMILKDKSPSCGVSNCKQWLATGEVDSTGTGVFAATVMQLAPKLPMLQSHLVEQQNEFHAFINQVKCYGH